MILDIERFEIGSRIDTPFFWSTEWFRLSRVSESWRTRIWHQRAFLTDTFRGSPCFPGAVAEAMAQAAGILGL